MRLHLFILFSACIAACKPDYDAPCREPHTEKINLTETEMLYYPFYAADTLTYLSSNGDLVRLISAERISQYQCFPRPNNPDCPDDSTGYQYLSTTYSDSIATFAFTAEIRRYEPHIKIKVHTNTFSFSLSRLKSVDSTFADSLHLNGHTFFAVFTQQESNGDSVYYTNKEGVIRYTTALKHYTLKL